ncbi:molybdenum cofactor sulfurase [Crotalus adamanteus]|uniref:Molybdenum cofactor sulfurase n=1 Tax=Crotalus adamanteus TaxID=8729 RepID=A0AAW1B3S2_CROAD
MFMEILIARISAANSHMILLNMLDSGYYSTSIQPLKIILKTFFGGGTAAAYLAEEDFYSPRQSVAERFEDGTVSFLDIIAVKHGFDVLEKITGGMENIKQHTFALAYHTYTVLSTLKYANGAPLVRIYSDTDFNNSDIQGPIINFNVLDENGDIIGYSQVDKLAGLYNIHMRTGCFCNTGACQQHLGISHDDIKKNLQTVRKVSRPFSKRPRVTRAKCLMGGGVQLPKLLGTSLLPGKPLPCPLLPL